MGISTSSVRRLEFAKLYPVQDEHGAWRFDPDEVGALVSTQTPVPGRQPRKGEKARGFALAAHKGRLAAKVFRMLAGRMTLPQIVVATKQPPGAIRALHREWCTSLEEAFRRG